MAGSGGVTWGPNTTHSIPFGGSPAPAQGAPAAPAPAFSFGSTRANTPAAPSTFGSTAAPAGGSLFGSSPSTGSLFGPSPAPQPSSLFGQPPAATGTGLFGQTPAPGMGLFGGPPPAPTLFGQPPQQPMQQAQLPAQAAMRAHMDASARQEQSRLANAMQTIHQQYIGTHPATQEKSSNFVKIVYNQATPEYQQMQYVHGMWANNAPQQQQQPQQPMRRPVKMPTPAQVSEKDWEEATVRNPDYNHYMPGALVGAVALQERLVSQQDRAKSVSEQLQTLQSCLDSIQDRHTKAQLKMKDMQDRRIQQRQKLLAIMEKVELYRCRNNSLQVGEIKAMQKAMALHAQVEHLMGMKEKLDDLAQEQIDQANAKAAAEQRQPPLPKEDIPDEEQLKQVLTEHREELTKLMSTVGTDARDLELIQRRVESLGLGAPRVSLPPSSSGV